MTITAQQRPLFVFLLILTISSTAGLHVWRTLFDNFAVHSIGLDGQHVGLLQSIREIPGFLCLLVVYVLLIISEHRLAALSVLLLGLGVALTGMFPTLGGIILTTLLMSFGFHYFETTNQSLTLQHFTKRESPLVLGRLRSMASGSAIISSCLVFLLSLFASYTTLYLLFGLAIVSASFWALAHSPVMEATIPQQKTMIVRRRYWLFYALTLMAGARRQIFIAFAVFLLVKKFDYGLREVAALFLVNEAVNFFLAPLVGKAINRFGERRVLSLEYGGLILIFSAYAMVEDRTMAAALYIADHIFFSFAIAIKTFFQKIADPADIAPSMAVGFTINHIAAVALPVIGGMLWMIDYRIPFFAGAVLSLVSLLFVQKIDSQLLCHSSTDR